jgi:lipoate-protein ligase B
MAAYLSGSEAAASFIQYPASSIQYLQFGKQIIAMDSKSARTWYAVDLGVVPYPEAWDLQLRLVEARSPERVTKDVIVLVEHPPVFTLGKRGGRENLLVSEEWLRQSGIPVLQVERGGNITYHGPGQLVVYPIVHLPGSGLGVVEMVDRLEEVMIRTCAAWGVAAGRNQLNRGVWVGLKKIGSIGIAVRRGVSFHGLALNVNPDLTPFGWIQPCGLEGIGMTSIQSEARRAIPIAEVKPVLQRNVEAVFQAQLKTIPREELISLLSPARMASEAGYAA